MVKKAGGTNKPNKAEEAKLGLHKNIASTVDRINKLLQKTGEKHTINVGKLKETEDQLKVLQGQEENLLKIIREKNQDIADSYETIVKIAGEVTQTTDQQKLQVDLINRGKKAYKDMESIARDLKDDAFLINELSEKELVSAEKKMVKALAEAEYLGEKYARGEDLLKQNQKGYENQQAILAAKKKEFIFEKGLLKQIRDRKSEEEHIRAIMGLTGNILKGIGKTMEKLGFDSDIFSEALKDARAAAKGTKSAFSAMWAGLTSMGAGMWKQVKDPLFLAGIAAAGIAKAFNTIKAALFDVSKGATDLGRQFGIAGSESAVLEQNLRHTAYQTDILIKEAREGFTELNKAMGTFASISEENLVSYHELTKFAGFSKELIQDMYRFSVLENKTLDETVQLEYEKVQSLIKQSGLSLDQKETMEGIGKISSATKLSLKAQNIELAEASVNAQKLGIEMGKLESIADGLLQFESSISAELEAELFTGRQLNFEKARYFALTNNIAGMAKELKNQDITAAKFGQMNRLAQEAIAKAFGLQKDEMADMLIKQELISEGKLQSEETSYEQLKRNVELQEKLNRAWENIKEIFMESLSPLLDRFESWEKGGGLKSTIDELKSAAKVMGGFMKTLIELGVNHWGKMLVGAAAVAGTIGFLLYQLGSRGTLANPMVTMPMTLPGGGVGGAGMAGAAGAPMMTGQAAAYKTSSGLWRTAGMKGGGFKSLGALQASGKLGGTAATAAKAGMFSSISPMGAAMGFGAAGLATQMGGNALAESFEESGKMGAAQTTDILSGAGQGALYGAALGSIIPGVGTAAGAIIGGTIGLMSGTMEAATRANEALGKELAAEKKAQDAYNQGLLQQLTKLNLNVKEGGNVYMSGDKVGTTTAKYSVNMQ